MTADIVPVLAAIAGLTQDEADVLFASALDEAKVLNDDRVDTKTFVDAVMLFRENAQFELPDLRAAWKARDALVGDSGIQSAQSTAAPIPHR
jgi:hypothetical protein